MSNELHFVKKYDIYKHYDFFHDALRVVAKIHDDAARKYSYFSWQNMPEKSDSAVEHCVAALMRHFAQANTGIAIDPTSDTPHLGHIVCRGHMLLTRYYRDLRQLPPPMLENRRPQRLALLASLGVPQTVLDNQFVLADQLTAEVVISMLKFDPQFLTLTAADCTELIRCLLLEAVENRLPWVTDIYNEVSYPDIIFWAAVRRYNLYLEEEVAKLPAVFPAATQDQL